MVYDSIIKFYWADTSPFLAHPFGLTFASVVQHKCLIFISYTLKLHCMFKLIIFKRLTLLKFTLPIIKSYV